jgi:PBP1b-binding outer membrane lipoprotein LpoB
MKRFFALGLVVMLTAVLMLGCTQAAAPQDDVKPTEIEDSVVPTEDAELGEEATEEEATEEEVTEEEATEE